jgi:hypothetical protein
MRGLGYRTNAPSSDLETRCTPSPGDDDQARFPHRHLDRVWSLPTHKTPRLNPDSERAAVRTSRPLTAPVRPPLQHAKASEVTSLTRLLPGRRTGHDVRASALEPREAEGEASDDAQYASSGARRSSKQVSRQIVRVPERLRLVRLAPPAAAPGQVQQLPSRVHGEVGDGTRR